MTQATRGEEAWRQFRAWMPVTRKWSYFDNAAVAPLPEPTRDAIIQWSREAAEEGDTVWTEWSRGVERTRSTAAAMIGADPEEIALVSNTTSGLSLIAEGFPWSAGDNMVTLANEFPSNLYPWLNLASRDVEARLVPVEGPGWDINQLFEHCDDRTRLISLSWVAYATGWRVDVAEIVKLAHQRGILVCLDAIQGLGVFPLDVRETEVDFVAADGHKWMLGPEGAGILFIQRRHLDTLRALGVGWNSVVHKHDYGRIELKLRDSAARYEGGSQNVCGLLAFGASLDMLTGCGLESRRSAIADRVIAITDLACRRLPEIGASIISNREPQHRSGIVLFEIAGRDPAQLRRTCLEQHVVLSCRDGRLRISPHAYVTEEDVDRLITALR